MSILRSVLLVGALSLSTMLGAQESVPASAEDPAAQLIASLRFQEGRVNVPAAHVHLELGERYQFLDAADTRRVLEELWGNPPDDSVLGMVVPRGVALTDAAGWAGVLTWQNDGYVSDADAADIDYQELLQDLQSATAEANPERQQAGYPTVELLGWAEAPTYDRAGKRLYWGKKLQFEGSQEPTLNYDIRVLGREGVLNMNLIASHASLATIHEELPRVASTVGFDPGYTYADFQPGSDRVAEYGLAALIGGGLAAKSGLLSKLLALLLAGKKFVILALIGIAAGLRSLLGRKKEATQS